MRPSLPGLACLLVLSSAPARSQTIGQPMLPGSPMIPGVGMMTPQFGQPMVGLPGVGWGAGLGMPGGVYPGQMVPGQMVPGMGGAMGGVGVNPGMAPGMSGSWTGGVSAPTQAPVQTGAPAEVAPPAEGATARPATPAGALTGVPTLPGTAAGVPGGSPQTPEALLNLLENTARLAEQRNAQGGGQASRPGASSGQAAAPAGAGRVVTGAATLRPEGILDVGGERMVLDGAEILPWTETCANGAGRWRCGAHVHGQVETILARSGGLRCVIVAPAPLADAPSLGFCTAGREDLSRILVRAGLARAADARMLAEQAEARGGGIGLWADLRQSGSPEPRARRQ